MTSDVPPAEQAAEETVPALPEHLSALVGSLRGPADLGRNYDKCFRFRCVARSD